MQPSSDLKLLLLLNPNPIFTLTPVLLLRAIFILVAWEKESPWNHPTVAGSGWVTVLALCTHFQGLAASARSAGNKAQRWDCIKLCEKLAGKAWRILGCEAAPPQNMQRGC